MWRDFDAVDRLELLAGVARLNLRRFFCRQKDSVRAAVRSKINSVAAQAVTGLLQCWNDKLALWACQGGKADKLHCSDLAHTTHLRVLCAAKRPTSAVAEPVGPMSQDTKLSLVPSFKRKFHPYCLQRAQPVNAGINDQPFRSGLLHH